MNEAELAKRLLSITGNEKFNAKSIFVKPTKHLFLMDEVCPACGLRHEEEIRGYIDKDHQEWGYYIKCPTTGCKVFMRRK